MTPVTATATATATATPAGPAVEPALTPAGERLLEAASDFSSRHATRAVGVELIAETAGTTKKTLYDRFGSKDELVVRYLRRRALRWQEFLRTRFAAVPAGPR